MRFTILLLITSFTCFAQDPLTIEDIFTRADLYPKIQRGIDWVPNSNFYCYANDDRSLYLKFNTGNEKVDTLFSAADLKDDLKRIPGITWLDNKRISFSSKGKTYFYKLSEPKGIYSEWDSRDAENSDLHHGSERIAFIRNNNLFIAKGENETQITKDGGNGIVYASVVHRQEFGITKGTFWSPSGKALAFYRMDESMVTEYPIVNLDSTPAVLSAIRYPMAGQTSHQVTLGIYNIETGKTIHLKTKGPDDHYLTNISWSSDEQFILIAELNRDQDKMQLNQYNASSGDFIKTLFTEEDEQWVEPENPAIFIPGSKDQFIWQSERNGFNHIYVYNLEGKQIKHLDIGNEVITEVLGFDPAGKHVYVMATANDGLESHCLKLSLNGKKQQITTASGVHNLTWNSSFTYAIDTYSSIDTPGKVLVIGGDGKEVKKISESADPLAMQALPKPSLIKLKASDGTTLNARLFEPINRKSGQKYPVVIYVYGGPHAQLIKNSWLGGANLWMSWMASQGYGVFTLDNRGSANRGLEFEQVIHRKLGENEMADQLIGVDYLKSLPWVNPERIGVHGWSFGGFMTTTLMCKNPGLFKAGVAGGPVIDWSLYEVMYTERYMDTPQQNEEGYETSNLLNVAKNLEDRLMLIHGTIDPVVVWQHSQRMVEKCVDEGVLIDYMIYPGHEHNVGGKDRMHLYKTITRYLMENLKEEEY